MGIKRKKIHIFCQTLPFYYIHREQFLFDSSKYVFLFQFQLVINNLGQDDVTDVKIGAKNLGQGMSLHEFPGIATLAQGASQIVSIGINFNDTTQAAKFDLVTI